jgi:hypothetical protein
MQGVNAALLFYKGILCDSIMITGLDYCSSRKLVVVKVTLTLHWGIVIQGDQKVSVHLMIAIARHLLTRRSVFLKTEFSMARSTFRIYSVMAIFKLSVVWGLFEYMEFLYFKP